MRKWEPTASTPLQGCGRGRRKIAAMKAVDKDFCGLLDASGFVPRAVCGNWTDWEILLNNVSDLLIALAYVLIPLILVYFARRRKDLPFSWMFFVFGAFIVTCGCTHILEIVLFYYPVYHLAGWLKALTALASWAAVLCLAKIAPAAMSLRSPAELEREVESRRRAESELAEKNRKLQEAEQLKDQFLANISHELRTPLTLILAPTEGLLSDSRIQADHRATLELIRGNSLRLLQQVNELLDYSKYQSGKLEVNRQGTEICALTRQLVTGFEPLARQRGINLQVFCAREEIRWMDVYLFERILFNLLSNAFKFALASVEVQVDFSNEQILLRVTDDGPGVAQADRQRIFERFQQGGSGDRNSGAGLGLALVREFASVLGGTVEVLEGAGAQFAVSLLAPVAALPGPSGATSLPPHHPMVGWTGVASVEGLPRVLMVEDEPELAAYMATVLKGVANVHRVRDASQAWSEIEGWNPALILSDVMMPGINGFEFCRQLKSSPRWAGVPVVLITALTHREALLEGWEAGADEYLYKPFHPTELITRVRTLLALANTRRQLEEQLRVQSGQLENLVAERTKQLSAALAQAEVLNEAKTRFLGNLSHELRTPLAAVLAMASLASQESPPPSVQDKLEKIQESARGLNGILEDLLELCRLDGGQLQLRKAPFELRSFLGALHGSLAPQAVAKGLKWTLEVDGPEEWWLEGDAGRLRQVLLNLLFNALKFTDSGGVHLRVGSDLTFSVEDTGQGIAPEDQERIFQRFVQADDSLQKNRSGLGLGLAICTELLALMGGRLQLVSSPGQGSRFFFQLVLPRTETPAQQTIVDPDPRHCSILLVEDHPLNRAAIRLMLERAGHRVEAAASGDQALMALASHAFELAILDLQLPDMDGFEILRRIRLRLPQLPVLALTAHSGDEWRERCLLAGFNAYLTKPVEQADLLGLVAELRQSHQISSQ